jgi:GTP cyclohydrolase I
VRTLLSWIGISPDDPGTLDTPQRVVKAFGEMTEGYREDPKKILSAMFDAEYDQMVILKDIDFTSLCEHHLLPFTGTATIAYIPNDKVVGLSKMARLTHCFGKRLQLQERMTTQIAQALMEHLKPKGVGVIVKAQHQCMACRGVRVSGATMVTSALLGEMRDDLAVRTEFLRLSNGG